MARTATGRWVARAAATGGGRTYRGQRPVNWYASLVLICILGVLSVVYSRYENQHPAGSTAPTASDSWFEALSFDVCGTQLPNLPANSNLTKDKLGIFTTGNGLINVAPKSAADTGANATLGRFVSQYPHLTLTATSLGYPNKSVLHNGDKCPKGTPDAGKVGEVQVRVWPFGGGSAPFGNSSLVSGDPTSLRLEEEQLITVAFVPAGVNIPKPPATSITALLTAVSDAANGTSTSTTVPVTGPTTATTAAPTTTVAPATTATPTTAASKKSTKKK